ncbi:MULTISPECIES: hypothetical protein [unclassified Streptomyces]|uniref:hypothetical protein n=1 Tax=unclassified Streptomyces TaxID=2593676 RepID=UPI001EF0D32A|nr:MULTISPECIES: hypothetical protein [unclassified Streptomyces]
MITTSETTITTGTATMGTATATAPPVRPVPLRAERVARLLPLLAPPVCLWRLPIGFDCSMGADVAPMSWSRWADVSHVVTLSLLSEACALLCHGLVRPWGEVVPRWVPGLRGRRIPPYAVIMPATLLGLLFTALLVDRTLCTFHLAGFSDVPYANGWWRLLAALTSGLMALWGPLILALTYAHHRRRRGTAPSA